VVSRLRLNPLNGRWVTIASERSARPGGFAPRALPVEDTDRPCPFCPGNEELPALESYGPAGAWRVRVVPNRFPAFSSDRSAPSTLAATTLGPVFCEATAGGLHEVLVLTPEHTSSWADLDERQTGLVMAAVRDRMEDHANAPGVRYTQAIVNHGREAGASLAHPHAQLLAMPFVPKEVADETAGFDRFVGGCLLCTTVEAELDVGHRVVLVDDRTLVVCPYWSGAPYELLVIPRHHEGHLHLAAPADVVAVGRSVQAATARLRETLGDVAYNVVFHTLPFQHRQAFHWHAHVQPRLSTRAGFEQGTGVPINVLAPEQAAADLSRVPVP
jgi:UDPglucose--hexose-1-phosphate uridylyltransferase